MKEIYKIKQYLIILISFFLSLPILSQVLSQNEAELFFDCLINNNEKIIDFCDQSEIEISNRLGITYESIDKKFLISYDIEEEIKTKIRKNELSYRIITQTLDYDYSKTTFSIPEINYQKDFLFKAKKLISPISFFTRKWKRIVSPHFIFVVSDTTFFNTYCIDNMEKIFRKMADLLNLNIGQLEKIKSQKIYYFLCKDKDEIKQLTGFHTRGIYILAFDYIITTFNNHYHELMHLLINFKLQSLSLYTHPFFQEGFAVAFGGRGGKEPNVILNLGLFLNKSKLLDYTALQSKNDFYQVDASLSYPISGLYNLFLIEQMGIDQYLKIYQKYSGTARQIETIKIQKADLPEVSKWQNFINNSNYSSISFTKPLSKNPIIYQNESVKISEDLDRYYFALKDTLFIKTEIYRKDYHSKKFDEFFPKRKYNGEKFLILANASEISIYNLYTSNLVDNFVSSFSIPYTPAPNRAGYYQFSILKTIFEENLKADCFSD